MGKFTVVPVPEDIKKDLTKASMEIGGYISKFIEKYEPGIVLSAINYVHAHTTVFFSKDSVENIENAKLAEMECFSKAIDQFNPYKDKA